MVDFISKNECTGCTACASVCPQKCITMVSDKMGFLYPNVDTERCVQCGLCKAYCPVYYESDAQEKKYIPEAYAAVGNDREICARSSSGGVFGLLAKYVLSQGGIVFGASFSDTYHATQHIAVDSLADLKKLQGSKYLQSEIGNAYVQAKSFLESGRLVLFTGTPCQISGFRSFLHKDYNNLYLVDVVCHGVPSPSVWDDYLTALEKRFDGKAKHVSFRDKVKGWENYLLRVEFDNGDMYSNDRMNDLYMRGFLHNCYLRSSCYECNYKHIEHGADMTLGDFWNVENVCPALYNDKGTSLVIVSSSKGRLLFEQIRKDICVQKVALDDVITLNPSIVESANYCLSREKFEDAFRSKPITVVLKKYCSMSKYKSLKRKIKSILNHK